MYYNFLEKIFSLYKLGKNKDIIIQKSDKSNSVLIVDKKDYFDKMANLLHSTSINKANVEPWSDTMANPLTCMWDYPLKITI